MCTYIIQKYFRKKVFDESPWQNLVFLRSFSRFTLVVVIVDVVVDFVIVIVVVVSLLPIDYLYSSFVCDHLTELISASV